jgi:AraC-like DNA-binding protein
LLEENKNVLEVAMDVGFSSRSSFYKAFKRYTGLTPSEYKKQNLLE